MPQWIVLGDWLLLARVTLAGTLLLAAVAKLSDRTSFRAALLAFGVPEAFAPPLQVVVPATELMLGGLLVPGATAPLGAGGASALLLTFVAVVGLSLARGRRPSCRCFGPLSADVIGPGTLVRNVALAALALFVVSAGPGPAPMAWWSGLPPSGRRLGAVAIPAALSVVGLAVVLAYQRRRIQDLTVRLSRMERMYGPAEGHRPGAPAPAFALPSLAGGVVGLRDLLAGERLVTLVFVTPGCMHCESLKSELGEIQERLDLALISKKNEASPGGVAPDRVLLQNAWEVGERYRCEAVPSAVVVGPGPWIASLPVSGLTAVRSLLSHLAVDGQVPDWALRDDPP